MALAATRTGTLLAIEEFAIHGQPNVAARFRLDGEDDVIEARLAVEAVSGSPRAGDRIEISMVLGEAFAIKRI